MSKKQNVGISKEKLVTYQHEDTGNVFTKLIPFNEPIPKIPRRFVIKIEWQVDGVPCSLSREEIKMENTKF
jgi:hypothetical protein